MNDTCPLTSADASSFSAGQNALQKSQGAVVKSARVSGETGKRKGLKPPVSSENAGSIPASPIKSRYFNP